MARSANIDHIGFHNFSLGLDSLKAEYDDTKMDKAGNSTHPKNIFANPFDMVVCPFTGLGCYIALMAESFTDRDTLFLGGAAEG